MSAEAIKLTLQDDGIASLVLDKPCEYCQVLILDDTKYGGHVVSEDRPGRHVRFVRFTSREQGRLKLDYKRDDCLPNLPGLLATALNGCAFCKLLREDLISSTVSPQGETDTESLAITEVTYVFDWDGSPSVYGINELLVFFTVGSEDAAKQCSLHYVVSTDKSDPCAEWLQIGRRPITNDRLSDQSLSWMRSAIDEGLQASPPVDGSFLPTRLLDLGSEGSPSLRLIVTKDDEEITGADAPRRRYAALSYCWGPAVEARKQLLTTKDNVEIHLSGIERDKLPRTISDAVEVCRSLDIRYLWVDALCIIQGNNDDWTHESFEMARVYSNSFLTLCILRGNSCSSGFLEPTHAPPTMRIDFLSQLDSSVSGSLFLRMLYPPRRVLGYEASQYPSEVDFKDAAWLRRGWTLQEDLLSPRKLYFGDFAVYYKSEQLKKVTDDSYFQYQDQTPLLTSDRVGSLDDNVVQWYRLVGTYTERELSYEHDKFPAVSALARSMNDRFPDLRYVAGLWESDLQGGLLWIPSRAVSFEEQYRPRASMTYIAPSWSWASCSGPVQWTYVYPTRIDRRTLAREFILRSADVSYERRSPHGRVLSARLAISGKLFEPSESGGQRFTRSDFPESLVSPGRLLTLRSEHGERIANLTLDWDSSAGIHGDKSEDLGGPLDQLSLLLVSSATCRTHSAATMKLFQPFRADPKVMLGLLVRPIPGTEDEYERLGFWYSWRRGAGGPKLWDKIKKQDIVLV